VPRRGSTASCGGAATAGQWQGPHLNRRFNSEICAWTSWILGRCAAYQCGFARSGGGPGRGLRIAVAGKPQRVSSGLCDGEVSGMCTRACTTTQQCGAGLICSGTLFANVSGDFCADPCTNNSQCPVGRGCQLRGNPTACGRIHIDIRVLGQTPRARIAPAMPSTPCAPNPSAPWPQAPPASTASNVSLDWWCRANARSCATPLPTPVHRSCPPVWPSTSKPRLAASSRSRRALDLEQPGGAR
jgi:hypothetical protein